MPSKTKNGTGDPSPTAKTTRFVHRVGAGFPSCIQIGSFFLRDAPWLSLWERGALKRVWMRAFAHVE